MASIGFYTWYSGTLADGRITTQLPVVQTSWSNVMDDAGRLQVTMLLGDSNVAATNPYLTAEPCRCFLAVSYTDTQGTETFLQAGPIWTHDYNAATRTLTIGAAGLWSYYDHRKVLPVLAPGVNPATAVTSYSTLWLGTIAKRLVQLAHTHTNGSVPVVFQADEAGTSVRNYPGYEMNAVGQMLRNITQDQGGPEISFVPRRQVADGRYLEWLMRVGTVTQPLLVQAGADWIWDANATRGAVAQFGVKRDGQALGMRAWIQGSGTQTGALFGRADDTSLLTAGFPLLEVTESGHENTVDQATVDAWAASLLTRSSRPIETWTFTVRRDQTPRLGTYAVGDYATVSTPEHDPYRPGVTVRSRIAAFTGDDSASIDVELIPIPGGV